MSRLPLAMHNVPQPAPSPLAKSRILGPPRKRPVTGGPVTPGGPASPLGGGLAPSGPMPSPMANGVNPLQPRSNAAPEPSLLQHASMPASAVTGTPQGKQWLQDTLAANNITSLRDKPPARGPGIANAVMRTDKTGRAIDASGQPIQGGPQNAVMRTDTTGRQVNADGSPMTGPMISTLLAQVSAPQGQGPMAGVQRPAPGNPGYEGLTSDQVIAKSESDARSQLDDPNYMPETQQGWEAKQARQNELAGQRRAASVQDMLSGGGTRAMGENGMPLVNASGAHLPNTVQGSVGASGAPVFRPDGTRMVEPVGGWGQPERSSGQMIPRSAQDKARDKELLDQARYNSDMRAQAKQEIMDSGGFGGPRQGLLGGLMDRVMGPQKAPDYRDSKHPGFADDVIRMEAAKEKRQRYLNSEGEYAGRGRAEKEAKQQVFEDRRIAIGQAKADARRGRLEARKNASMPIDPMQQMAMRNPAFALGMQKLSIDAQQADLDRQIQREELGIRRDALTGGQDERKQARLDAMKVQQSNLQLEKDRLAQQGSLGQAGIAQDQAQHDERMQQGQIQIEDARSRNATDQREANTQEAIARAQIRTQIDATHPNASEEEKQRLVNQAMGGGAASAPAAPGPGGAAPGQPAPGQPAPAPPTDPNAAIPEEVRGMEPADIVTKGRDLGWSDEKINEILAKKTGSTASTVDNPDGSLGGIFGPSGSFNPARRVRGLNDYIRSLF
jgi:hypothetical protein